ncbi:hypothetical protein DPMN_023011 [Dreissena polymorpha]|uniref:Uncharacterized protein n=1 Tax=Dreissena polymorpha TaxID=45954 RepID=A0A9D4LJY0_DREPO|nr:hypothetical protein DPMN_023011 [Dreissena polymorpha]
MIGATSGTHLLFVGDEEIVVKGLPLNSQGVGREQRDSGFTSVEDGRADLEPQCSPELRRGGLMEVPRGGGTQYAQRTGETVLGIRSTAVGDRGGHKGGAARFEQKEHLCQIVSTP